MEIMILMSGGPRDGQMYRSDAADRDEAEWARVYYSATGGGEIGRGFRGMSPAAMDAFRAANLAKVGTDAVLDRGYPNTWHHYRVTARAEEGGRITVTFTYLVPA